MKESAGGLWEFVGLLPLLDLPRHDSAWAIRRALDLGANVKMITGDQLAIGKETDHRLGMGTNMYTLLPFLAKARIHPSLPFLSKSSLKRLMALEEFSLDTFGVRSIREKEEELMASVYLQVSIVSQALIFVRPGLLLCSAFIVAPLVATVIAVYANWGFARIHGIGWGWAGVIWIFSVVSYIPLNVLKFIIRFALSGKAWDNMIQKKTAFTTEKDYGKDESNGSRLNSRFMVFSLRSLRSTTAKSRLAWLRELHTLEGHVEWRGWTLIPFNNTTLFKGQIMSKYVSRMMVL